MARGSKPLMPNKNERRLVLARLFLDVVGPLLEAGESYSDISVERLITAVDVSRSTFYSYFKDKGELLAAMAEDVTTDLSEAGGVWFSLDRPESAEDLATALRPLLVTYRRHQAILRSITDGAAYDPNIRTLHTVLVRRAITELSAHFERSGFDRDPVRTATWLVWMLERGLYHVVAPADDDELEVQVAVLADLLWRALYA